MAEEISLPNYSDLPDSVPEPTQPGTLSVVLTYRRVIGYFKNGKDTVPAYGGALAEYQRENAWKLDRSSLLKPLGKD